MEHRLTLRLLGALTIFLCSLIAEAQPVFIPDMQLRALLSSWAPGAVDVNGYLDPQHPNVLARSRFSVEPNWDPVDLTGLESLDQLDSLYISFIWQEGPVILASFDTSQVSVNAWPPNLTNLSLSYGTYGSLPPWPEGLTRLTYKLPSGPTAVPPLPALLTDLSFSAGEDLMALPDLPSGLQKLTLSAPVDNVVPALPTSVTTLSVTGFGPPGTAAWPDALVTLTLTNISAWPSVPAWPSGLQKLTVNGAAGLISLPGWPSSLTDLSLSSCSGITALPPFPSALESLYLRNDMALTALPDYPPSLTELHIGGLGVTTLPEWPVGEDHIDIIDDLPNLISMPDFPSNVHWISLAGDLPQSFVFPEWPSSLNSITVTGTNLQTLPDFPPSLYDLELGFMDMDCLPLLPEGLLYFLCYGCGISCIPNAPAGMLFEHQPDGGPAPLPPLCTVLNSTCDFVNPAATGTVYWDQNTNGVRDGGEPGYPFAVIHAQPGNITYGVPPSGDFNLPLPLDQYTLTASSNNPYVLSISPASHDAPFVNASDVDSGNDFGVVLQPNVQDVRIDLEGPWGRPGFESSGHITYDNIGSTVVNGTVTLQLDASLNWIGSTPPPTSVNGNMITWDYTGLQIGERRSIGIDVYTDPGVPLGTQLQHTATVGPIASDETPADNTATSNTVVEGSFDPNDKRVEPTALTPTEVATGKEVIYTIRFQNTGTYQADRVIITDELSDDLQWNTMRLINSSHPCAWVLSGDGRLRFTFEPILLPDSTSDEPGSHGYVRFAMKPVSDLMLGESVGNTANIYFDFNAPVMTNAAVFSVDASTAVQHASDGAVRIWPNPARDVLYIEGLAGMRVEMLDVTGRILSTARLGSGVSAIVINDLPLGIYSIRSSAGNAYFTHTFTKY